MKIAQAILLGEHEFDNDKVQYTVQFLDADGNPLDVDTAHDTGAEVLLTGYAAHAAGSVAAADSVNVAMAKLEARIAALETP